VLALEKGPVEGTIKRLIVTPGKFNWKEAVELIREKRPQLVARLPSKVAEPTRHFLAPLSTGLTEKVLGIKQADYASWEETVLETIDLLVAAEK
jgi:hypothetical protein